MDKRYRVMGIKVNWSEYSLNASTVRGEQFNNLEEAKAAKNPSNVGHQKVVVDFGEMGEGATYKGTPKIVWIEQ